MRCSGDLSKMNLENFNTGDTKKKQIFVKGPDSTNMKRHNSKNKTSGDLFMPGKKIQLDLFGQELLDAENHCNKLKAELQQFRRELPLLSQTVEASLESITPSHVDCIQKDHVPVKDSKEHPTTKAQPTRQTSSYISTDNTGAAVITINNILNGITESVNRLSHLHAHAFGKETNLSNEPIHRDNAKNTIIRENIPSKTVSNFLEDQEEGSCPSLIEEIPVCSPEVEMKPKDSPRRKKNKAKQRIISNHSQDSSQNIQAAKNKPIKVTARRVDKKPQIRTAKTSMVSNNSESAVTQKRRKFGRPPTSIKRDLQADFSCGNNVLKNTTAKLVELYHNKAVKNSDSDDEEDKDKKKKSKAAKLQQQKAEDKVVPPLDINDERKHYKDTTQITEPEKEIDYQEPATPRTQCSLLSRNYELPTIASKLKEVAKCYLQAFNFHMIPFCPAMSTSPSHNIGINIQQVLNIIKTRQPVCSISPTLAHNIGLAAEKLNSQPLHALVSTLSSRMTYGRSQCPLLKTNINYQQLQEMAKEIPEEDGGAEEEVANNGIQDNNVPAYEEPTKDTPIQSVLGSKGQIVWSIDQNRQLQCTCIPNPGVGFKQVLNKYSNTNNAGSYCYSDYHVSQQVIPNNTPASMSFLKAKNTKATTLKRIHRTKEHNWIKPMKSASSPQNTTLSETARKRKNLKEVLQNLHDEFDALNSKYEALSRQIDDNKSEGDNTSALKELENIEKELTKKEEEINMVVALYKEVAALKEQVKNLRKKASQSTISLNKPMQIVNNSQAALHLTKLLRQIQHIHSHCNKAKT